MVHAGSVAITCSFPCTSWDLQRRPSFTKTRRNHISRFSRLKILSSKNNDDIVEKFMGNNSIADFMRFSNGDNSQLQTAVVGYRKKFPWSLLQPFLQVDLVSTIHIADKEYFTTLQEELDTYDCVLYEMVASKESLQNRRKPENKNKLKGARGFNILGFIQRQMAKLLTLDFQLDCLDYQSENWYHADLDFETFKSLQIEKGESFFTFARDMTLRSTKAMVQQPTGREDLGPWRSKLLWASRVVPMPLVGLLIIGGICADVGSQNADYPEFEALSRLLEDQGDFGVPYFLEELEDFELQVLGTETKILYTFQLQSTDSAKLLHTTERDCAQASQN